MNDTQEKKNIYIYIKYKMTLIHFPLEKINKKKLVAKKKR